MILSPAHEVLLAGSGAEALEILRTTSVDLVTLDLNMPGMKGDEVMRTIRNEFPYTALIVITSYGSLETATAGIRSGIAEGRVQVGMSGAQVLKTLGTKPSSSVRMAYSGSVAVLWVFEDYGITVRLQRRSSSTQAEVVEIATIP